MDAMERVMIVAGESSGDAHAAHLIRALRVAAGEQGIEFFGIGGEAMRAAGVDLVFDARALAVIGPVAALPALYKFYQCFKTLIRAARERKPSVVVLVDFPDLNLRLAKRLKTLGFNIVYYISPQVWAWKKGRISTIKRYVDRMLVILPFEKDFYRAHGMDVDYVGHPLVDRRAAKGDRKRFCAEFDLREEDKIIALLPGSRKKEVNHMLPSMLKAAAKINTKVNAAFIIAKAKGVEEASFSEILRNLKMAPPDLNLRVIEGRTQEILDISDFAIVKSGTSTVEAILAEVPFLIVYRISWLSWLVGQMLIDTPHYGLVNLIAGERVIPELIQGQATPDGIANAALELLCDDARRQALKGKLTEITAMLGEGTAARSAAQIIARYLHSSTGPGARPRASDSDFQISWRIP